MDAVNLIGVDPGIVDTGVVWARLDRENKIMHAQPRVWRNVTRKVKGGIEVDQQFLDDLQGYVEYMTDQTKKEKATFTFIEGYRNRGRNPGQDQKMTVLVQTIHKVLPGSQVVDNTGVKNVVTDATLGLLGLNNWGIATHHSDLDSAARILLKGAYQDEDLNSIVADVVRDRLEGRSWTLTNSPRS